MEVISLISNKKLVKGGIYKVKVIKNSQEYTTNGRYNGVVLLEKYGSYNANYFTTIDGKDLPSIDYGSYTECDSDIRIEVGDILIPLYDNLRTLRKGEKYRVVEVIKGNHYNTFCKVKFEGINRFYEYTYWRYEVLSKSEVRDMLLDNLTDNIKLDILTTVKSKLDLATDKKYELIKLICKGISDPYYNTLPLIEWICDKVDKSYNVKKEDFDPLMEMSLKEIIEIFEKNNNISK
ncbi:MAG: hypothetical protein M0R46_10605 [Candidatus Muirbacterium halophilum]|nr:hypothetical protein [Candidatus Muirbacterium halophilum]